MLKQKMPRRFNIWLPQSLYTRLERRNRQSGTSVSEIIRQAVSKFLPQEMIAEPKPMVPTEPMCSNCRYRDGDLCMIMPEKKYKNSERKIPNISSKCELWEGEVNDGM